MSYDCSGIVACPQVQAGLLGFFNNGFDPAGRLEPTPFTEWLAANQGQLQQDMNPGGANRKRPVQLIYQRRKSEDDVSETAVQDCDGGAEPSDCSHTYEIDETDGVSTKWSISPSRLIDACNSDEYFFARELRREVDALVRKMETRNINKAVELVGNFVTTRNSDAITVSTENADGVPNRKFIQNLKYQYFKMLYTGTIYTFAGGQDYLNFWSDVEASCCNTVVGVDLGAVARNNRNQNIVPFTSDKFARVWGEDKMLSVVPGALQLVTYKEFASPQTVMNTATYVQGTFIDPVTQLEFDYVAKFDCGKWNFQLKLAFDLFAAPDDMFRADDFMSGVNFVNQWTISNPS